jgi:hypothetical protein
LKAENNASVPALRQLPPTRQSSWQVSQEKKKIKKGKEEKREKKNFKIIIKEEAFLLS